MKQTAIKRTEDRHDPAAEPLIRAAQYLRKSTSHQEFSTALQAAANHAFAAGHGMEIVRTYADEGKSGLRISGRAALNRLLADVQSGVADFTAIVVYDVCRWGRFQDIDESGYYEHICKRAGFRVHYCVEQFVNDGSPFSVIIKNIKRAMAAEYSRELSAKVFAAHARLARFGYSQGGPASYGLRRLLVPSDGGLRIELRKGDRKNLQGDRVVWVPGAPEEVETVRRIFEGFTRKHKKEREIAQQLNQRRVPAMNGRKWTRLAVRRVLSNERYVGNYVWNRISTKLNTAPTRNMPDRWIRTEGVVEPIVRPELFAAAQRLIRQRARKLTEHERLEPLRRLLAKHGRLTAAMITRARGVPAISSYERWFGGLIPAYELIGYTGYRRRRARSRPFRSRHSISAGLSNADMINLLRPLLREHGFLNTRIISEAPGVPHAATYAKRFGDIKRAYRLAGYSGGGANPYVRYARGGRRAVTSVLSNKGMLAALRRLLRKEGRLTRKLINESRETPSSKAYFHRFGSVERAYRKIGYESTRAAATRTRARSDDQILAALRSLLRKHGRLTTTIIDESAAVPTCKTLQRRFGSLRRAYECIGYSPETPRRGAP